jgi:hypothetical protein
VIASVASADQAIKSNVDEKPITTLQKAILDTAGITTPEEQQLALQVSDHRMLGVKRFVLSTMLYTAVNMR